LLNILRDLLQLSQASEGRLQSSVNLISEICWIFSFLTAKDDENVSKLILFQGLIEVSIDLFVCLLVCLLNFKSQYDNVHFNANRRSFLPLRLVRDLALTRMLAFQY
jgi:hypothetical protein